MKNQGDVSQDRLIGGDIKTAPLKFTASDIVSEYTLFNHGILFGPAGLRDPEEDPLVEWYNRLGDSSEHVLRQAVETPIFRGLDALAIEGRGLSWNNLFCGIHSRLWPDLLAFMCSMTLANRNADHVYLVTAQTVMVPDPVVVDRQSILADNVPEVPITVFGLDGSRDQYKLGVTDRAGFPAMFKLPPKPATIKLWQQIKEGNMAGLAERTTSDMEEFMREHAKMRQAVEQQGPNRDYRRIDDGN
jgi:hypothetical protein